MMLQAQQAVQLQHLNAPPFIIQQAQQASEAAAAEEEEDGTGGAPLSLADLDISEHDLSPQELRDFQRAVAAGRLSHLVEPWQPWWLTAAAKELRLGATGQPVVQEVASRRGTGK